MTNLIHVHPEDLFDKERQGALTADERRYLDAHLSRCEVCRCERRLRADFEEELARQPDGNSLAALVSCAIEHGVPERDVATAPHARRLGRSIPRGARAVLIAATLVLACGFAAARSNLAHRAWHLVVPEAPGPDSANALAARPIAARRPARSNGVALPDSMATAAAGGLDVGSTAARSPADTSDSTSAAAVATGMPIGSGPAAEGRAPSHESASRDVVGARRGARASSAARRPIGSMGARDGLSSAYVDGIIRPSADSAADARDLHGGNSANALPSDARSTDAAANLFERANLARRQGRLGEASQLYSELRNKYPASAEARLALGLVARIELDRGNPAAALANYNGYLATGGSALREEALAGRALALGRLGRTDDERQTWSQLLSSYPNSSYARLASKRLALDNP